MDSIREVQSRTCTGFSPVQDYTEVLDWDDAEASRLRWSSPGSFMVTEFCGQDTHGRARCIIISLLF
ncbi:hypothetical protein EON65_18555 [archaeon]|nr:MAG: hypothetical protein EON65_18555 [archaeon]